MKKIILLLSLVCGWAAYAASPEVIDLWPDGAPNSNGLDPAKEIVKDYTASATVHAKLYVYRPQQPNGIAILACPGGGYGHLALGHEGKDMADWMNRMGITYCVLQYRMPGGGHSDVPLSDVWRAMDVINEHAAEWGVKPGEIGIMGSSAGGHLAASGATLYDAPIHRPAFQVLFYPVISMDEAITHKGSRVNLIGENPTAETVAAYSLENRVTSDTPEAFIMVSADDNVVPVENTLRYVGAMSANNVPFSLHVYPTGGHGWGYRDVFIYKPQWTSEFECWLRERVLK